jgi:hypothetical protein
MKKLLLLLSLTLCILITAETYANVYASGIRISDEGVTDYNLAGNTWDGNFLDSTGVKIWFIVNEAGGGPLTADILIYISGYSKSFTGVSVTKGVNSIVWDGWLDNSQPAPIGQYSINITVTDPVGHTSFDSVWVTSAFYQGPDPDGGTAYGYRGNASVINALNPSFGSLFVSRGSSQPPANGFYKYRADGVFTNKADTVPSYPNSTPNEISANGNKVYGLAGYGFTGSGFSLGFDAHTDVFTDSMVWGTTNMRGLTSYNWVNVITYYSGRSGTGLTPAIMKMVEGGTPAVAADLSSLILAPNAGYIKAVAVDDNQNMYAAFGNASASRKKIAKFSPAGDLLWVDSLDNHGIAATGVFQSLAIYHDNTLHAGDDILYALIYSPTISQWGIYRISTDGTTWTQLVSPQGASSAATSQFINVDAVGNVIWSNGSTSERIICFSPADGPNSSTIVNPNGYKIDVQIPIPVELTAFSASLSGKDVVLNWTTSTETNNKGFEVERNNGSGWNVIGFVNGNGTTTLTMNYRFVDKNVSGKLSYRLKQIDYDGTFKYSNEIEADVEVPEGYYLSQNYPNPFNPVTNISFRVPADSKVRLEVFSLSGELVKVLADDFRTAGEYSVSFDASRLSSGTYIYRLTADQTVISKKMILMK